MEVQDEEEDEEEADRGQKEDQDPPVPLPPLLSLAPLLSNSQELDSGVGRTDDSTRCEELSEQDQLGEQTSACNTNTTNTPGSTRKFRVGHSPRYWCVATLGLKYLSIIIIGSSLFSLLCRQQREMMNNDPVDQGLGKAFSFTGIN